MRALVSLVLFLLPTVGAAADPAPVAYHAPVGAPVSDPFRPPATRFGPGNRGVEFATLPGDQVRAAASGTVTFAGPVAGRRYLTLLHADGVRTAYGPLARIEVRPGDHVEGGAAVGIATGPLLWTARIGDAYVDPAVLLAASGRPHVRLVASGPANPQRLSPVAVSSCAAAWALGRPC